MLCLLGDLSGRATAAPSEFRRPLQCVVQIEIWDNVGSQRAPVLRRGFFWVMGSRVDAEPGAEPLMNARKPAKVARFPVAIQNNQLAYFVVIGLDPCP